MSVDTVDSNVGSEHHGAGCNRTSQRAHASLVYSSHIHDACGPERQLVPQHLAQALPFRPCLKTSLLHGLQNSLGARAGIASECALGRLIERATLSDVAVPQFGE